MRSYTRSIFQSLLNATTTVFAAVLLGGCSTLAFYGQAISGQFEVIQKRQRIDTVLSDDTSSSELRRKLELVLNVREFAVSELGLPDNDSYRSYADLQRPYVIWNVFATPELSLVPVDTCVLFFGCISYRSYFSETAAERHAASLRTAGHDVYVGGVAAYSTVGWFDDPVLNTMLGSDDAWIIKVIFHELAHQLLHVRNDTAFNESFATMVAQEGLIRWSRANGPPDGDVQRLKERQDALITLILEHRTRLEQIYSSDQPEAKKRGLKTATYEALRAEYQELKRTWGGYEGYDDWMSTDLNNAKLASVVTYHDYVPAFEAILTLTEKNIERFYGAARALAQMRRSERDDCLRSLMRDGAAIAPSCVTVAN
jgi:predicted aminopeptidase